MVSNGLIGFRVSGVGFIVGFGSSNEVNRDRGLSFHFPDLVLTS